MDDCRIPEKSCLNCGSQVPQTVRKRNVGGRIIYECPKCGSRILQGIISTNGEPANLDSHPPTFVTGTQLPHDITWDTWEAWWTGVSHVTMIHGRVVRGSESMKEFVTAVSNIYANNS